MGLAASKAASRAALEHVRAGFGRSQVSLKHIKRMTTVHTRTEEMVVLDDASRGFMALRQQLFKAHLKYLGVLRNLFGPASAEASPAEVTERLAKGSRRLLQVVTHQIQAGEALVAGWVESAAWLERNPSEQHGRAGLRRVLREAMLEVEATASHLNQAATALADVVGSLPEVASDESPVKARPAAAPCGACGAKSASQPGYRAHGKRSHKNSSTTESLSGSLAPATPQRSAELLPDAAAELSPSQPALSPFAQVQENLSSPGEGRGGSRQQREPREPISYPTASQLLNYDAPHLQQLVQQLMDEISHLRTEVSGRSTDVGELEGRLALQQEYIELLEEQAVQGSVGAPSGRRGPGPGGGPAASEVPLRRSGDGGSGDGSEDESDVLAAAAAASSWSQEQRQRANSGVAGSSEGSSGLPIGPSGFPIGLGNPVRGLGVRALAIAARFGSTVQSSRVPPINRVAAGL